MSHSDEQTPIRERWTARPTGTGDEAAAGALLRTAAEHGPLDDKRLAEIQQRLRHSRPSRVMARPAPRLLRQLVFAGGFVLCGGVLSASVMHVMRRPPKPPVVAPAPAIESQKKPARRPLENRAQVPPVPAPVEPEASAPPVPPAPAPSPAPSASSQTETPVLAPAPRSLITHRRVALKEAPNSAPMAAPIEAPALVEARPALGTNPLLPPTERPSSPVATTPVERMAVLTPPTPAKPAAVQPEPSRLARESRWLASAIAKLRQEGQPEQALQILDQHRSELGSGALASETNATRIEALLRLGRNAQALSLLDEQRLSARGLEREMLVARAELRADKGRTSAAVHDFDLLLSSPGRADGITERALFGRATCRAKGGDRDGARRDFTTYLDAFPQGRFAAEARAALSPPLR